MRYVIKFTPFLNHVPGWVRAQDARGVLATYYRSAISRLEAEGDEVRFEADAITPEMRRTIDATGGELREGPVEVQAPKPMREGAEEEPVEPIVVPPGASVTPPPGRSTYYTTIVSPRGVYGLPDGKRIVQLFWTRERPAVRYVDQQRAAGMEAQATLHSHGPEVGSSAPERSALPRARGEGERIHHYRMVFYPNGGDTKQEAIEGAKAAQRILKERPEVLHVRRDEGTVTFATHELVGGRRTGLTDAVEYLGPAIEAVDGPEAPQHPGDAAAYNRKRGIGRGSRPRSPGSALAGPRRARS